MPSRLSPAAQVTLQKIKLEHDSDVEANVQGASLGVPQSHKQVVVMSPRLSKSGGYSLSPTRKTVARSSAPIKSAMKSAQQSFKVSGNMVEDREHRQYFTSWGTPDRERERKFVHYFYSTMTDRSALRVRKVVLENLPAGADLTFVQSLVSGGALENFMISETGSAFVVFTTGDACDAFYDKYPNGITFRYKGKQHTVFVEKDQDVLPITGT